MSHSHPQMYLIALFSRSMEVQGDGSSSLRPEPNRFSGSLCGVLNPLAARRRWSQMWFGDRAKALVAREGNVSEDLELETLRKRLQSSVQKSVN